MARMGVDLKAPAPKKYAYYTDPEGQRRSLCLFLTYGSSKNDGVVTFGYQGMVLDKDGFFTDQCEVDNFQAFPAVENRKEDKMSTLLRSKTRNSPNKWPKELFEQCMNTPGAPEIEFVNQPGEQTGDVLVVGGDMMTRGPANLAILAAFVALKVKYPDRVYLIAGNRDLNHWKIPKDIMEATNLAQKIMETEKSSWTTLAPEIPKIVLNNYLFPFNGAQRDPIAKIMLTKNLQDVIENNHFPEGVEEKKKLKNKLIMTVMQYKFQTEQGAGDFIPHLKVELAAMKKGGQPTWQDIEAMDDHVLEILGKLSSLRILDSELKSPTDGTSLNVDGLLPKHVNAAGPTQLRQQYLEAWNGLKSPVIAAARQKVKAGPSKREQFSKRGGWETRHSSPMGEIKVIDFTSGPEPVLPWLALFHLFSDLAYFDKENGLIFTHGGLVGTNMIFDKSNGQSIINSALGHVPKLGWGKVHYSPATGETEDQDKWGAARVSAVEKIRQDLVLLKRKFVEKKNDESSLPFHMRVLGSDAVQLIDPSTEINSAEATDLWVKELNEFLRVEVVCWIRDAKQEELHKVALEIVSNHHAEQEGTEFFDRKADTIILDKEKPYRYAFNLIFGGAQAQVYGMPHNPLVTPVVYLPNPGQSGQPGHGVYPTGIAAKFHNAGIKASTHGHQPDGTSFQVRLNAINGKDGPTVADVNGDQGKASGNPGQEVGDKPAYLEKVYFGGLDESKYGAAKVKTSNTRGYSQMVITFDCTKSDTPCKVKFAGMHDTTAPQLPVPAPKATATKHRTAKNPNNKVHWIVGEFAVGQEIDNSYYGPGRVIERKPGTALDPTLKAMKMEVEFNKLGVYTDLVAAHTKKEEEKVKQMLDAAAAPTDGKAYKYDFASSMDGIESPRPWIVKGEVKSKTGGKYLLLKSDGGFSLTYMIMKQEDIENPEKLEG